MKYDWIVLGAGWAGLLSLLAFAKGGHTTMAVERGKAGGLAQTMKSGRYRWDLGPHALYSKNPRYLNFLEGFFATTYGGEANIISAV